MSNEVWATCMDCGSELKQGDKQCPMCGSTKKSYERKSSVSIGVTIPETRVKQERVGYRRFIRQIISRFKSSGDPRLTEGVHEERIIDKEKDEYHQVVKDLKTGHVIHEEHEPLSKHKNKLKH